MFSFFKPKLDSYTEVINIGGPINVGKQSFKVYFVDEGNNKQIMDAVIYGNIKTPLFNIDAIDLFFRQGYIRINKMVIPIKQVIKIEVDDIQDHMVD